MREEVYAEGCWLVEPGRWIVREVHAFYSLGDEFVGAQTMFRATENPPEGCPLERPAHTGTVIHGKA